MTDDPTDHEAEGAMLHRGLVEQRQYEADCAKDAEITRLRAEVERLTRERDDARDLASVNECGANEALDLMDDLKALCEVRKARAKAADQQVAKLREALVVMVESAQEWCDAVERDSSWDGWDHHYKSMSWETLPAIRAALAETEMATKADLEWAVSRWFAEVADRPLKNIHRRSLDDAWRQVIRHFGGDDEALCGPAHDDLVATETEKK